MIASCCALAVACGSADPAPPNTESPGARTAGRTLPLERYALSPEEHLSVLRAVDTLTESCMKRQGVTYKPPSHAGFLDLPRRVDRRYGVTDVEFVENYGYHIQEIPVQDSVGKLTKAERGMFEECKESAERTLHKGAADYRNGASAEKLMNESFYAAERSDEVRSAVARWSACLKRAGYSYKDPLNAGSDVIGADGPTEEERRLARADARCNNKVGLADVWYRAEVKIQRSNAVKHEAELKRLLVEKQALLLNVKRVERARAGG